jgi:hypothetical protein
MDIFFDRDTIVYTSYDIEHFKAEEMKIMDYHSLPSSIHGVNGTIMRYDLPYVQEGSGNFYSNKNTFINNIKDLPVGKVGVKITDNRLFLKGNVEYNAVYFQTDSAATLYSSKHTEPGKFLANLNLKKGRKGSVSILGEIPASEEIYEFLATGSLRVAIKTKSGEELSAQLYPEGNHVPKPSTIISHSSHNIYGIRNTEALYTISWSEAKDKDGDLVSYTYQLATDSSFMNVVMQKNTSRQLQLKIKERELYALLNPMNGKGQTFFHRVISSDGKHFASGTIAILNLMKSTELPDDYIDIAPPHYTVEKIRDASGAGIGAVWDREGKLWLADYNGT